MRVQADRVLRSGGSVDDTERGRFTSCRVAICAAAASLRERGVTAIQVPNGAGRRAIDLGALEGAKNATELQTLLLRAMGEEWSGHDEQLIRDFVAALDDAAAVDGSGCVLALSEETWRQILREQDVYGTVQEPLHATRTLLPLAAPGQLRARERPPVALDPARRAAFDALLRWRDKHWEPLPAEAAALMSDRSFVLDALRISGGVFKHLSEEQRGDRVFARIAVMHDVNDYWNATSPARESKDLAWLYVRSAVYLSNGLPPVLREDREAWRAYLASDTAPIDLSAMPRAFASDRGLVEQLLSTATRHPERHQAYDALAKWFDLDAPGLRQLVARHIVAAIGHGELRHMQERFPHSILADLDTWRAIAALDPRVYQVAPILRHIEALPAFAYQWLRRETAAARIKWLERFSDVETLTRAIMDRKPDPLDTRPVAMLFATPTFDSNGAFRPSPFKPDLADLQAHYRVLYFETGTTEELISDWSSAPDGKVMLVAHYYHGQISSSGPVSAEKLDQLRRARIDRKLAPGAAVVLFSCLTGMGGAQEPTNVANTYAAATLADVWAPQGKPGGYRLRVDEDTGQVEKVRFTGSFEDWWVPTYHVDQSFLRARLFTGLMPPGR